MTEDNGLLTRRTVLRSGAGAAALGAVGAGAVFYSSQSALAAEHDLGEDDTSVRADEDGELVAVEITPDITVEWSNLDDTETTANIEISAAVDPDEGEELESVGESYELSLQDDEDDDYESGETSEVFDAVNLYNEIDGLSDEDIADIDEDETFNIDVEVAVTVDDDDNVGGELEATASSDLELTVQGGANLDEISGDITIDATSDVDDDDET
ncbi:hypothetical protein SAMN04487967_2121 [Natronorubrum sediminis]|uniref:Uncharacterized protein n=1 Tax=Natronorubrum sediminis TaxID=640943 RepID=A0A1H6FXJ5_9EURY|nr:hypothetical protein [Natronorubrum sediminis]SEH15529.1 hypothetical protein SAMN04487967_2121 [Natronorubrum sediminis]